MIEPLPCPFCGCNNIRVFEVFESTRWRVDCNLCNGGFECRTEERAIAAWNQRARPVISDAMVEAGARRVAYLKHGHGDAVGVAKETVDFMWPTYADDARAVLTAALGGPSDE
jgi:Lar family restriction alleviation protein